MEDLGDHRLTWPERAPRWRITVGLALVEGRPECVRLHVEALNGKRPRPITSAVVRELPVGRFIAEAREALAKRKRGQFIWQVLGATSGSTSQADYMRRLAEAAVAGEQARVLSEEADARPRKGGQPGYPRSHYVRVAEVYLAALASGDNPRSAVAEQFGVSKSAAAKQVARARDLGLLAGTTRGRASGPPVVEPDEEES